MDFRVFRGYVLGEAFRANSGDALGNRRLKLMIAVVCIAILLPILVVAPRFWDRHSAMQEAREAFLASRPGAYDSEEFITRGVTQGMSPSEVDGMMADAYESTPLMGVVNPTREPYFKQYCFRYGRPTPNPVTGRKRYLYEEWICVWFDESRRAQRVQRIDAGQADLWYNFSTEIDWSNASDVGSELE